MKKLYTAIITFLLLILNPSFLNFVIGQAPVFYGMTLTGGTYNNGAIIKFDPATNNESVVWSFGNDTDGAQPYGELVLDKNNGLFYGLTSAGGSYGLGAIVSFDPATNNEKLVWSFGNGTDGSEPYYADLVYDPNNGLFYSVTHTGGTNGFGTIFSFDPATNKENVVWNFNGGASDGAIPYYGSLVFYPGNGWLYGMTLSGGTQHGTIFSFNPATNKDTVLWNFGIGTDGQGACGELVYNAANGLFYGQTGLGGTNGYGVIFTFDPLTDAEHVVWNYTGSTTDGGIPYASLVPDAGNGLFYAMTHSGGSYFKRGTIISFDPIINKDTVLWSFGNDTDGQVPDGNLTFDPVNGLFYGMTQRGGNADLGQNGGGTIFGFNPATDSEQVLWNLGSGTDGVQPLGSLVLYNSLFVGFNASDTSFCAGASIHFDNLSSAAISWQWYFPGAIPDTSTAMDPFNITYNVPGKYNVELIARYGNQYDTLSKSNYIHVDSLPTPVVSAADSIMCPSDSILISVSGSYPYYHWNTNQTTSSIYAGSAGGYWVTVTGSDGCQAVSGHQNISVYPVPSVSIIVHGDTLSSFNASEYQWYFDGNIITGANSSIYIAHQTGDYSVEVTDTNGCQTQSNSVHVVISGVSSLSFGESQIMRIYPNPTSGQLFIAFSDNSSTYKVRIFNAMGQEVSTRILQQRKEEGIEIDMQNLPVGVYELQLMDNDVYTVGKVVKSASQ